MQSRLVWEGKIQEALTLPKLKIQADLLNYSPLKFASSFFVLMKSPVGLAFMLNLDHYQRTSFPARCSRPSALTFESPSWCVMS